MSRCDKTSTRSACDHGDTKRYSYKSFRAAEVRRYWSQRDQFYLTVSFDSMAQRRERGIKQAGKEIASFRRTRVTVARHAGPATKSSESSAVPEGGHAPSFRRQAQHPIPNPGGIARRLAHPAGGVKSARPVERTAVGVVKRPGFRDDPSWKRFWVSYVGHFVRRH